MNTLSLNNTFLACLLSCSLAAQTNTPTIIYVRPGGHGDGSSWEKATNDLPKALNSARKGNQIWVAAGLFLPTDDTDRTASFVIPDGVKMYGGFAGNEKSLAQRSFMQHPTILSGNIGSNDPDDNSYNVIFTKNAGAETALDGFVITGGCANGDGQTAARQRSGGAWYNDGSLGSKSNPTVANCTFIGNFAKDGGAMYNNGKDGEASPRFVDCYFEENKSDLDGGAVYNDGKSGGISDPYFENCTFNKNHGNYGGAVFNYGMGGNAEPRFSNCIFSLNESFVKGGAIFHLSESALDSKQMFANTQFSNNQALDAGSENVHNFLVKTNGTPAAVAAEK